MLHLHDSIVQSSHSMEAVNSEFDWANQWNQIESSLYLWGGVLEALDVEGDDCDSTEEDDESKDTSFLSPFLPPFLSPLLPPFLSLHKYCKNFIKFALIFMWMVLKQCVL